MAKRDNELFIGTEYLNLEGRSIKHPALIETYANVTANKLRDTPIPLEGIDIETDSETGEMMLLGFDDGDHYSWYTNDFTSALFMHVKKSVKNEMALAYWNRLDPYVILRTLIADLEHYEQERALLRFGKEGGQWDKKAGKWVVDPIISIEKGNMVFGIKEAIRSSIKFFLINENGKMFETWAFDIAQLYQGGLEKEAKARFDWYSKVDDSAHKVSWPLFRQDKDYRENIVLKSNRLDAQAARSLGYAVQEDFKKAFGMYSKSLISQGGLARAAIVAVIRNKLKPDYQDEKTLNKAVQKEIKAIGFMNYYDEIAESNGHAFVKDLYATLTEAYSGGLIEAVSYGKADYAWYADIASAYPGVTQYLYDLRGATWSYGKGEPKRAKKGYTIIRGTVNIPHHIKHHPLTVKHPRFKDTNIRPTGTFKATYTIEERDFLIEDGATFEDEEWYKVETKGDYSPLALATTEFVNLRQKLKAAEDTAEWMAKSSAASVYGITYEATDIHKEIEKTKDVTMQEDKDTYYKDILKDYKGKINCDGVRDDIKHRLGDDAQRLFAMWHNPSATQTPDMVADEIREQGLHFNETHPADIMIDIDEVYRMPTTRKETKTITVKDTMRTGYRAGEFWNPLYATIITSRTRIIMAKAARAIDKANGQVILMMTDSITWTGSKDMIPGDLVRDKKTLGYFETPEQVKDIVCLGSGRYGFTMRDKNGKWTKYEAKRRGLNAVDITDPDGNSIGHFHWGKVLEMMRKQNKTTVDIKVRTLISPGIVVNSYKYGIQDLGRIVEQTRNIQSVVGHSKRNINPDINDPKKLATTLVETDPLHLDPAMFGKYEVNDQTLPLLRKEMMKKPVKTRKDRKKKSVNKAKKSHYQKNKDKLRKQFKVKYLKAKSLGYDTDQAKKMGYYSDERFEKETGHAVYEIKSLKS